jgi:hypothetical protein
MSRLVKIRDLVVYRDDRHYCGPGPSAVQLHDGTIVVVFRRAHNWVPEGVHVHGWPSTEACLTTSSDGGQTWSTPRIFTGGNITNQNLTLLPDGTLICITQRGETLPLHVYERLKDDHAGHVHVVRGFGFAYAAYGVQAMRSTDGGLSWEGPFFVLPIPGIEPVMPGWASPAGLRASAISLQDGAVGVAVYGHNGPNRDACAVWFMVSSDRGETWKPRGRIVDDPQGDFYYNETGVYQCASGKLVAFMRVERDPDDRLHTSVSTDGGRTWTAPRREEVKGHPYQAARLSNGNVLLAYGYRHEPRGIRARLLDPECVDVSAAEERVLRDDGGTGDLGYPHVLPLSDGTALVSYYHNIGGGTRHIAATLVAEDAAM